LEQACTYNPDGFGFSVLVPEGIITDKGMKSAAILDSFEETVKHYGSSVVAWVFHARITTHGATCVENCHPFPVGAETVIAHNGILPVRLPHGYKGSDSSYFAETLFPMWGGVAALAHQETWDLLETWMGSSKVVILTEDPSAPLPLIILNEGLGEWVGDHWYSNLYHRLTPRSRQYGYSAPGSYEIFSITPEEPELGECLFCGWELIDEEAVDCYDCGACLGCGFFPESCRCVETVADEELWAEVWQ
jgi:glutamine amidotransferase